MRIHRIINTIIIQIMVASGVAQRVGAGEAPCDRIVIPISEAHKPGVVVDQAARKSDGELQVQFWVAQYVFKTVI